MQDPKEKSQPVSVYDYATDYELCRSVWPFIAATGLPDQSQFVDLASLVRSRMAQLDDALHSWSGITATRSCHDILVETLSWFQDEKADGFGEKLGRGMRCPQPAHEIPSVLMITASLLLTIDVVREFDASRPFSVVVRWPMGKSLREAVAVSFDEYKAPATGPFTSPSSTLKRLNMATLVKSFGYSIRWTDNLKEHLTIKSKQVWIYKHKLLLAALLQTPRNNRTDIIPRPVVEEALDTLNLLFPPGHRKTGKLLKQHSQAFHSLGYCGRRPAATHRPSLQDYPYWGAKLQALLAALDEPPALGVRSMFLRKDKRNLVESVNFWLALLVAVLTVASIVLGVLGVVYAKLSFDVGRESLELTRQQWLLSLAQACAGGEEPQGATQLAGFCSQAT
ncbi:uncharacterized protein B0I36DRAFT_324596 [Microdochium trichocladiopsis]|uniref:Uncharacterized protein n=1 Tax=Microdochium trichocladiopsis TaxID=1682393 RepID=A0A9P8Y3N0_9PEZI|nr:uncharacterized protein B0I36DRAFT_324596 [Microdochium trichocladiopsis]KAH7028804.1 hypothetical protein B0I36DRAFT_324596 [Microdochium trichocladiopsis]